MRDRLQQRVARRYADEQAVGILDETRFLKKGEKTACVQRQHCGAAGKRDNCVVSVHPGYASPTFHTMLDGELYLPKETWNEDADRRREAGVPDQVIVETLLLVAFSRWKIERLFEDSKMELGLDHFEVRKYASISRHLLLGCVSHLFLAELRLTEGGGKNPPLTINQLATATSKLALLWARGGRCSHRLAQQITAQLTKTQHRNDRSARSHRKRTIRRLHAIGIKLKDLRPCHWPRE